MMVFKFTNKIIIIITTIAKSLYSSFLQKIRQSRYNIDRSDFFLNFCFTSGSTDFSVAELLIFGESQMNDIFIYIYIYIYIYIKFYNYIYNHSLEVIIETSSINVHSTLSFFMFSIVDMR